VGIDVCGALAQGRYHEGLTQDKLVLVYLAGRASTTSRIMDKLVLADSLTHAILRDKFVAYKVYADVPDKNAFENNQLGQLFTERGNTRGSPWFIVIDPDGKVISETGYTREASVFVKFLRQSLK